MTGRVPARVDEDVKAGLLDLVDDALEQGFSRRRAATVLKIDDWRLSRWIARSAAGRLGDLAPGGNPVHGLPAWEVEAILAVCDEWGEIDRSHRKLAHRGSRVGTAYVSESTFYRVLLAHGVVLPGPPRREPAAKKTVARLGRVAPQPGVGLGRDPLRPGQADRARDHHPRFE